MKNFRLSTKLLMGATIACSMALTFTSCSDDDDDDDTPAPVVTPAPAGAPEKFVALDIDKNTMWSKDTIYLLAGRIKVRPGATLTIQAGTIIKGLPGQATNAKVLMVMRGGKIMAEGTATEPIIFTASSDQIQPGQVASPNLPNDFTSQWGGLALLGNAVVYTGVDDDNDGNDDQQLEGVPDTDKDGLYGGNNNADNSGVLRYVSVRHGGTLIGGGDELNGISFAGVGSGTVVENIEIVATADDGLEFYGGSVNATNVVVWNNGDDGLDTDMGYTGTISNFVLAGAGGACFELDGPESNATNPGGNHTFRNGTVIASRPDNTKSENLLDYDGDDKGNGRTNVTVENVHFTGVVAGQLINANQKANSILSLSNITVDVDAATLPNYIGANTEATNVAAISVGTAGKADLTKFDGWTWSRTSGAL